MSNIEEYKKVQSDLTRQIIFEQDKEVLRQTAHNLVKSNNDLVMKDVVIRIEMEKLLALATVQNEELKKLRGV